MKFDNFLVHQIYGYISSVFLVEYKDKMLLLDSGSVCDVERIENYCNSIHRNPSEIKLVFVSHMHPDHSGGACKLRQKHHIPIAAFQKVDCWYAGIGGCIQYCSDCLMEQYSAKRQHVSPVSVWSNRILHPDYLLHDNDVLPFFEDWKAIYVPGHTLHDIAVYHPEEKLLYASDCIVDVQGRYALPLPVVFPDKMKTSLDRLAHLNPVVILRAHGPTLQEKDHTPIFEELKNQLDQPATSFEKRVLWLSLFSQEIHKEYLSHWAHHR